jgi:hypothetical protein
MTHNLIKKAKQNCCKPLPALGNVTPVISGTTVRRVLAEEGLYQRKAQKVVYPKGVHKKAWKR